LEARGAATLATLYPVPAKKSKSVAIQSMDANMSRFNSSYEKRTAMMQNCWKERQ
jgi:hypothetical protein